ncbi:unnamed protein product (macronuclear) [Paramecium tetraurelia]|uniref:Uncharacterized protein n=1 Tax=Paramecium tetraurelia TaxID=5888 RepID=A0CQR7_PARTE|nr:uncharacterized protein GSPATT00009482001 [Paramecium tetraurelia]CAK73134.1 unnamed protein product [Paramecium tetraurelia]|eukprot:XP_001440531.1 hypothetical protein (macronuclear) [Paramecium tetraurelia strain d4-2]
MSNNRNEEIIKQEIENEKLAQENKFLNQELSKVLSQQKYDDKTLKIIIKMEKYKQKESSELKFRLFPEEKVLEISGLIQERDQAQQNQYYVFFQKLNLESKVTGKPKITQKESSIEIIFDIKKF